VSKAIFTIICLSSFFSFRTFPDRQHARMCRCLVIIIFVFKVSSHLSNGVDSSLSKSFPHFLRLQVFKYFQEWLRLQTFKIFECIQHALCKFSCHPFRRTPSSIYLQDLHSTSARYAGYQPLSTGFIHSFVFIFLFYSLFFPSEVDDQISVSCLELVFFHNTQLRWYSNSLGQTSQLE